MPVSLGKVIKFYKASSVEKSDEAIAVVWMSGCAREWEILYRGKASHQTMSHWLLLWHCVSFCLWHVIGAKMLELKIINQHAIEEISTHGVQWAAVNMYSFDITVPPHNLPYGPDPIMRNNRAAKGYLLSGASFPPTMRVFDCFPHSDKQIRMCWNNKFHFNDYNLVG